MVKSEAGATVIVVAYSLLILLGFAALTIDAGMAYDTRRSTTNAADSAALAAAWEQCNPEGVGEEEAALATAAANGYEDTDPKTEVEIEPLGEDQWRVTITHTEEGVFGPATPFAGDTITVVSEATALCDPTEFLGGMAIFAGAEACATDEVSLSGTSIDIEGGVHSNGDLQIHSTPVGPSLSGPTTYRGSGNHGEPVPGSAADFPLDLEVSDYAPGGGRATGNYFATDEQIDLDWLEAEGHLDSDSGELIHSGIYYTSFTSSHGEPAIDLEDLQVDSGVEVTFVAHGRIEVSGDLTHLRGHDPVLPGGEVGVLFLSDHPGTASCTTPAIRIQSASLPAAGLIYAPNGSVDISDSTVDLAGSIIGWRVEMDTSDLAVHYQDDPAFVPEFQVELIR